MTPKISIFAFTSAPEWEQERGMLGWLSLEVVGLLFVDGVALRRTRDGVPALSFPARRDCFGRDHPYVRPLDDAARREIERQVFAALGLEEPAV